MCGIVGAVSAVPIELNLIEAMRDRLAHRGPDHAGIWMTDDRRVCFGHRRLAIIDLSPEANQPFVSADGRLVITFNGEIYNFQSLRDDLVERGVVFQTHSDTEVLIEAYRYWGAECLDYLSGMFAFAIWDRAERQLFCARDRVGEKPFYYTSVGDSFIFASELKALLLWPGVRKRINYPALVDYLTFGFVADPKTIWEGFHKLPPGHYMSVTMRPDDIPELRRPVAYWDLEFDPDHSVTDWRPRILETLQSASREMAFADVAVGAFLSGGVDSSSVTAALSKAGCPVNTFTVGFQEEDYDERPWARQVAALYQTPYVEKVVTADDVAAVFEKLLWHYDEPFNDYSYLPTFYLCREARRHITVALSGDGGDEMFAGYRKYQRLGMRQEVERFIPRPFASVLVGGANSLLTQASRFRNKLSQYGMDAPTLLTEMLTVGFSVNALRAAARGPLAETLKEYSPLDAVAPLLCKAPPAEVGLVNAMRYLDLKLTLAGDILVKVDRASMAVSLEVRPVYLHRDLIALAASVPAELLADRNHSKEALKSALKAWLPEPLLYRRKQGFAMPLKNWISGDLLQFFSGGASNSPLDDLLNTATLDKAVDQHAEGRADMTGVIHALWFLDHWLKKWE